MTLSSDQRANMDSNDNSDLEIPSRLKEPVSETHSTSIEGTKSEASETASGDEDRIYLEGIKLHFLTIAICLSMFFSSIEVTIVSTTLVAITDDFDSYELSSWIITSYLLTYTGFLIIWAKLSDLVGRRLCYMLTIVIFCIFSGACGASQTIRQLIIFRAFQGIGASGMISLSFVITAEMVPAVKYGLYGSITSFAFAIGYLLGPIFGGLISNNTTWRWVFLLNPPGGALTLLLIFLAMPAQFPNLQPKSSPQGPAVSKNRLSRVDFPGFLLLLAASIFFVAALEQSGIEYAWSHPLPISFLVISGVLWILFFVWSKIVSQDKWTQEPVFTWNFVRNRIFLGVLIIDLLAGVPFFVTIILIPQRFQIVNGMDALEAGVRMLAFILCIPFATSFASLFASKLKVPPIYLFAVACAIQIVGTALFSTLSVDLPPRTYGYEIILGFGIGLNIGTCIIWTPNLITGKDQAVAMGAMIQLRALGGAIGLSIASNILLNNVRDELASVFPPDASARLLSSGNAIAMLPEALQATARSIYADGYSLQMQVMIGFAAAQALPILLMLEKKPRRVA